MFIDTNATQFIAKTCAHPSRSCNGALNINVFLGW